MTNLLTMLRLRKRVKTKDEPSQSPSNSVPRQYVLPVCLCLDSYADVGKALKKNNGKKTAAIVPRKIKVGGKFLNTMTDIPSAHHKRSLRRVLRRGCVEVALIGSNPNAPRRVYDLELNFVLERLHHDMIQTLHIENLNIQSLPTPGSSRPRVAKLLGNLQKLSGLQRIVIKQSRTEVKVLKDVLAVLGRLPCLREVTLDVLDLDQYQMQELEETLARLLQSSTTIQSISLPQYPTSSQLWQALTSCPSLRSLSLPCQDEVQTRCDLSHIQQLLLQNTQLEALELRQIHPGTKFAQLANGLQHNITLESLHLTLEDHLSATPIRQSMVPVLKYHNFTLTQLEIHRAMHEQRNIRIPCPTLDFYTQLNRHSSPHRGRYYLLRQEATADDWSSMLIEAAREDNLSALYYWLRVRPNHLAVSDCKSKAN